MELDFFRSKLFSKGIEAIIPNDSDRTFIHSTIFDELGKGIVNPITKKRYINIINQLIYEGAEGIILGCTEIPLLIKPEDVTVPTFDTTRIHSKAAVEFSLRSMKEIPRLSLEIDQ
jgi:aspartate racemase